MRRSARSAGRRLRIAPRDWDVRARCFAVMCFKDALERAASPLSTSSEVRVLKSRRSATVATMASAATSGKASVTEEYSPSIFTSIMAAFTTGYATPPTSKVGEESGAAVKRMEVLEGPLGGPVESNPPKALPPLSVARTMFPRVMEEENVEDLSAGEEVGSPPSSEGGEEEEEEEEKGGGSSIGFDVTAPAMASATRCTWRGTSARFHCSASRRAARVALFFV